MLASYTWTYDSQSRISSFSSNDGTSAYSYDNTDQLTGVDHSYQTDESYSHDANGNRTSSGYSTGDNNRLLSDGTYNYEYDDEGNRTKRTRISDGSYIEYTWDHRNRLTQAAFKTSGSRAERSAVNGRDCSGRTHISRVAILLAKHPVKSLLARQF